MKKLGGELALFGPQGLLGAETDLAILLDRHVGQHGRQLGIRPAILVGSEQTRTFAQTFDGKRMAGARRRFGPRPFAIAAEHR